MSLKSFHVFFLVVAVLLSAGVALWAFTVGEGRLTNANGIMGLVSAVIGVATAAYATWFVRKKSRTIIV